MISTPRPMVGLIKTSHLGFEIVFSENGDVWRCFDLEMEHASLAKLKEKIAAHERKSRKKAEAFEVIYAPMYSLNRATRAWVVSVDREGRGAYGRDLGGRCWIMVETKGSDKRERMKVDISTLAPSTPENWRRIDQIREQEEIARQARAEAATLRELMGSYTRESLLAASPSMETEQ